MSGINPGLTSPAGGPISVTNDGTFAKETGGNLAGIKTDLDEIALDTDNLTGIKSSQTDGTQRTGTSPAAVAVGQTTSNTTAVQLSAISAPSTNGILVQAISTNTASIFIGGSGVTVGTGFELQAGQTVPFTVANITSLYVIGSNNTDKVCWNVL